MLALGLTNSVHFPNSFCLFEDAVADRWGPVGIPSPFPSCYSCSSLLTCRDDYLTNFRDYPVMIAFLQNL